MIHYNVPIGLHTVKHFRVGGKMALTDHDGSPDHPMVALTELCETPYPASVCTCGWYQLTWGQA